jgi:hypothetical protein
MSHLASLLEMQLAPRLSGGLAEESTKWAVVGRLDASSGIYGLLCFLMLIWAVVGPHGSPSEKKSAIHVSHHI